MRPLSSFLETKDDNGQVSFFGQVEHSRTQADVAKSCRDTSTLFATILSIASSLSVRSTIKGATPCASHDLRQPLLQKSGKCVWIADMQGTATPKCEVRSDRSGLKAAGPIAADRRSSARS